MYVKSNVAASDYSEWSPTTAYIAGDTVIVTTYEKTATVISNYSKYHRGNFVDGSAFFEIDSTDLTVFEGTDDGSTPYAILLTDATGNTALGYIGAGGDGEELGVSLISDGAFNFNTGTPFKEPLWIGWGTKWIWATYTATYLSASAADSLYQDVGITTNSLYYSGFSLTSRTSGTVSLYYGTSATRPFPRAAVGVYTEYATPTSGSDFGFYGHGAGQFAVDNVFVKEVIEPETIANGGFHVVSEKDGTYRGWASIDSGFDPNSIASYKIYQVGVTYHKIYEATASNTGKFPPYYSPTSYWIETSSTNRWKSFDKKITSQTSNTNTIEYELTPGDFDSVAFFNLDATTIDIKCYLGGNLTINGELTDDANWTKDAGWTIVGSPSPSTPPSPSMSPSESPSPAAILTTFVNTDAVVWIDGTYVTFT
jgi:hypothetical protein